MNKFFAAQIRRSAISALSFFFVVASVVGIADAHSAKHAQAKAASREFDFRGARLGMSITDFESLPPLPNSGAPSCAPHSLPKYAATGAMECSRPGDNPFLSYSSAEYIFCPDGEKVVHLCAIALLADRENFDQALRDLSAKWGQPDKVVNGTAENGFGQPVATHKMYWSGGANKITLQMPCADDLRYFCVNYDNSALEDVMEGKAKQSGTEASKF